MKSLPFGPSSPGRMSFSDLRALRFTSRRSLLKSWQGGPAINILMLLWPSLAMSCSVMSHALLCQLWSIFGMLGSCGFALHAMRLASFDISTAMYLLMSDDLTFESLNAVSPHPMPSNIDIAHAVAMRIVLRTENLARVA